MTSYLFNSVNKELTPTVYWLNHWVAVDFYMAFQLSILYSNNLNVAGVFRYHFSIILAVNLHIRLDYIYCIGVNSPCLINWTLAHWLSYLNSTIMAKRSILVGNSNDLIRSINIFYLYSLIKETHLFSLKLFINPLVIFLGTLQFLATHVQ